jgi:hypothetical protein
MKNEILTMNLIIREGSGPFNSCSEDKSVCAHFMKAWRSIGGMVLLLNYRALHEGVPKLLRTGAAVYTAVVVVRSTGRW